MIHINFNGKLESRGEIKSGTFKSGDAWSKVDCIFVDDDNCRVVATAWNETLDDVMKIGLGSPVRADLTVKARQGEKGWWNNIGVSSCEEVNPVKNNITVAAAHQDEQPKPQAQSAPKDEDSLPF